MGVRAGADGEKKLIELSYDNEKKWRVLCCDGNFKEVSSILGTGTPHQVAIMLKNGTQCTVYVDGQRVGWNEECALRNGESKEISHFYIGGDGEKADNKEGVSVTVTNVLLYNRPWDEAATGPSDGVKFTGRGAGAQWPVGKQGENQLYHFANYNFTLVATVSIDGVPKEGNTPIPVMGVRAGADGEKKLIELSYDNEKKWRVLCCDGNFKEVSSILGTGTPHQVAIMLKNGTQCTVYVDGQRVGWNEECALRNGESKEISHFYIGGDGEKADNKEGVSVTVTNVLLY
ncbi:trans-sialidase, putative, partial [Trypanosoma cruzi]